MCVIRGWLAWLSTLLEETKPAIKWEGSSCPSCAVDGLGLLYSVMLCRTYFFALSLLNQTSCWITMHHWWTYYWAIWDRTCSSEGSERPRIRDIARLSEKSKSGIVSVNSDYQRSICNSWLVRYLTCLTDTRKGDRVLFFVSPAILLLSAWDRYSKHCARVHAT